MQATSAALPGVRERVSAAEWALRVDLAAAYRLVALFGWDDLVFTHVSARVPDGQGHFLINPYGMMFDEITASSLVKIDRDGRKVMEAPYEVNPGRFLAIHACIHAASASDAHRVMCMSIPSTASRSPRSVPACWRSPSSPCSCSPHSLISDYEGVALNPEEQPRLAVTSETGPSGAA